MSAKPYEDPEYGHGLYGISSKSYVNMKDSSLDVRVDGDKLNKKNQKFKIGAKDKEKAALKYKKTSVSKKAKKYIKVSSKGNVTVRKGLAMGLSKRQSSQAAVFFYAHN